MGVACPPPDDPGSYTMVDPGSAGGSCRCACQEDQEQEESGGCCCCSPHVFTSILLGFLSCVLMTGGVFLAFHRWDPMWLMVSGVGVVLILIGTVLHCCHHASQRPHKRRSSAGKCPRPLHPPDHHHHHNLMPSGSLTEQLLPLSNARSVSQLSLNMLPGYFPPVVTAYGIEQHSAVVQNINRQLIQQQSQQSQQSGSCSPGIVSNGGKSFIVLSLPSDAATPANIQNLVATVYQLDGSAAESSANEASQQNGEPVTAVKPNPPVPLILKNAEVQTCSVWPVAATIADAPSTSRSPPVVDAPSTSQSPSAVTGSTQTEDDLPPLLPPQTVDLMDCSPDSVAPICDNAARTNSCDNQDNAALVHIPPDVPEAPVVECCTSTAAVLVDIPETTTAENLGPPTATTTLLFDVVVTTPPDVRCSEVLVDITTNPDPVDNCATVQGPSTSDILVELPMPEDAVVVSDSNLQTLNAEQASSSGNLSSSDTEMDESELMGRSSPPPSYEDVTTEGESGGAGAFGLAYGTI